LGRAARRQVQKAVLAPIGDIMKLNNFIFIAVALCTGTVIPTIVAHPIKQAQTAIL
jgi:hypothetical protein